MTEEQIRTSKRSRFLVLNLALILICIGSLVLLIVFYPLIMGTQSISLSPATVTTRPALEPTATPIPFLSPTLTNTLFPTPTPSVTTTPTLTDIPSLTSTPLGPPTLTPARALPLSGNYDLVRWSPEKADYLIQLINDYPNTFSESQRGEDNKAYYQAFEYAIVVQREGLLRYPDAPQAQGWGLAYNLARTGDSAAGSQYSELIVTALNRGETDISYLYAWFQEREPRMNLYMVALEPLSGYLGNYLLEIRGSGSSFIWLLQSSSGFRAYPLFTNFDFVNKPQADWIVADLNGDLQDGQEIAIYFSTLPGEYWINPAHVFNLSQIPPKELPLLPVKQLFNVGMQFDNNWVVTPNASDGFDLLFESAVFPACPVVIRHQYQWKGEYFGLVSKSYQVGQNLKTPSYCQVIVDHVANVWGAEAAVAIMEPLIDDWPPEKDMDGQNYPPDAKDEWRYRLGIYYALTGDAQTAQSYLLDLVNNPTVFTSRWVRPAREFLEIYQLPQDLYAACLPDDNCNPSSAIETLVKQFPPTDDVLNELRSLGVNTSSSGYFDFDDDEEAERWFTVRYRSRSKLNFWILAAYSQGYKALYVGQVDSTDPGMEYLEDIFVQEEALSLQPAVLLDGKTAFSMQRLPDSQEPYLLDVPLRKEYPDRFLAGFRAAEEALFSGASPSRVQDELLNLAYSPGLLCQGTWSCDPYYYLLGLSSELAGDSRAAVDAYHTLWLDYSRSPYTTMARLKLLGGVYVSPTPTATQTPVITIPLTPTQTFTPFATVTGTPPTATPSPTATATIDPNITSTVTASATITPIATNTPGPTNTSPSYP